MTRSMGYKLDVSIKSMVPLRTICDSLYTFLGKRNSEYLVYAQPTQPERSMDEPDLTQFTISYETSVPMSPNEFINRVCVEMDQFLNELRLNGIGDVNTEFKYGHGHVSYNIYIEDAAQMISDPALDWGKIKTNKWPPCYNREARSYNPKDYIRIQ